MNLPRAYAEPRDWCCFQKGRVSRSERNTRAGLHQQERLLPTAGLLVMSHQDPSELCVTLLGNLQPRQELGALLTSEICL